MKNLRLISTIIVKDKLAIQSFNYKDYLPLGKVEIIVKNFDRWNSDEILVNCIDRSKKKLGPDFELLEKISSENISTPIIYGGGIRNLNDAVTVIKSGADRILLENLIYNDYKELIKIKKILGSQAIVLSLPLLLINKKLKQFDYINDKIIDLNQNFKYAIKEKLISEILLIDKNYEGSLLSTFDSSILKQLKFELPLIYFGGINSINKIKKIINDKRISAVGIGNSLNYSEHRIQKIKDTITKFRKPFYSENI